jgi:hypothetical protein
MTIIFKNYEIEVQKNSFDLYQTRPPKQNHKVNGNDEVRCCHGYFTKLPAAIRKIIQIEMANREEKVQLSNYFESYKLLLNEIENKIDI